MNDAVDPVPAPAPMPPKEAEEQALAEPAATGGTTGSGSANAGEDVQRTGAFGAGHGIDVGLDGGPAAAESNAGAAAAEPTAAGEDRETASGPRPADAPIRPGLPDLLRGA